MGARVLRGDILSFCHHYHGPKFHALLCDPPYELSFMSKKWDGTGIAFHPETWAALAEHLLPGAFGMAFASSRGWHRLAVAIEDAGLRIHPSIFGWCYGSGFPKATRIDTQIDKAAGAERTIIGQAWKFTCDGYDRSRNHHSRPTQQIPAGDRRHLPVTIPATDRARAWEGYRYGLQALKPALEPIIVFQKPYTGKPVESIVETGAGALNIDGARLKGEPHHNYGRTSAETVFAGRRDVPINTPPQGRWPANFFVQHHPDCVYKGMKLVKGTASPGPAGMKAGMFGQDRKPGEVKAKYYATFPDGMEKVEVWDCHPDCPVRRLGEQAGGLKSGANPTRRNSDVFRDIYGDFEGQRECVAYRGADSGTAARFFLNVDWQLEESDPVFYCAKASRKERDVGLDFDQFRNAHSAYSDFAGTLEHATNTKTWSRNPHPTVKPFKLTQWLATLLLPPEEYAPRRILIPFSGSGSEMIGAALAGWEEIIGVEMEREYCEIARARLNYWTKRPQQLELCLDGSVHGAL